MLFVEGRLSHETAAALERAIVDYSSNGVSALVIDLSGVDYVSGAALKVFRSIADRESQSQRRMRLRAPSDAARFALELSGLLELVDAQ